MFFERSKEAVFVAIVAFVLTGALWRVFSGSSDAALDGDTRTQVILAAMYSGVALLAIAQFRWTAWLLTHSPALVGLLLVAFASPIWAQTPDLVFRRAISLLGTSLFGVVLASRLTFNEQARLTQRRASAGRCRLCGAYLWSLQATLWQPTTAPERPEAFFLTRICSEQPWPWAYWPSGTWLRTAAWAE